MENSSEQNAGRKNPDSYGDGSNLTHHLGNDDYPEGANLPETEFPDEGKLEGKEADGNLDMLDEDSPNQGVGPV